MMPYAADLLTVKIEINQVWPVGAPAGLEDEIEYWFAPGGLWVPPEWGMLSLEVVQGWVHSLRMMARPLKLAGHTYEIHGNTALPEGQDPCLIYYKGQGLKPRSSGAA